MPAFDMVLYHSLRSTCSRKVRICLGEKGIEFESRVLDLRKFEHHTPEYLRLNPNGYVPTLVDDGRALIESTMINEYLDERYPQAPLRPGHPYERLQMRVWTKFVDDVCLPAVVVPTWTQALSGAVAGKSEEELKLILDRIPLPERRSRWAKIAGDGYTEAEFREAYDKMTLALDRMEHALRQSRWLVGDDYTLADINISPYVWRFREIDPVLLDAQKRPAVASWLERMLARPAVAQVLQGAPIASTAGARS
jgi:glutathione S-transferase